MSWRQLISWGKIHALFVFVPTTSREHGKYTYLWGVQKQEKLSFNNKKPETGVLGLGVVVPTCDLSTPEANQKFKTSLGYIAEILSKKKKKNF